MVAVLPNEGGALDQDYMLTWAFGIIEEAHEVERKFKADLDQRAAQLHSTRMSLLG